MTDKRESTLNNGNPIRKGTGRPKDSVNKYRKEMLRIGEENCLSLYKTYLEMATSDPDKETRRKCHEFLLEKVMPRIPHRTYFKISFLPIDSINNIKKNVDTILKNMGDGFIALEEAKDLFSMMEQARKTYETNEMAKMMFEIDQRMKKKGI